ncbi:MAG: flagellar hook-basal body complex protein FliE [Phycisphaeraceae bacterium]|nr:flagellar hook-basal body complex protein FliE [Phycisphaeraceae bacterium]
MSDPLGLITNAMGGARPVAPAAPSPPGAGAAGSPSFKDVLMKNLEQVNQMQQNAEKAIEDLAAGRRDDLSAVMTSAKNAEMAFNLLLQVRNKMLAAYDEIKQMRV